MIEQQFEQQRLQSLLFLLVWGVIMSAVLTSLLLINLQVYRSLADLLPLVPLGH